MQTYHNQTNINENVVETKTVLMTTPQAAAHLGLSVSTLNKWRVYGQGPKFIKLGRAVRYRLEDLHGFTVRCARMSTSE